MKIRLTKNGTFRKADVNIMMGKIKNSVAGNGIGRNPIFEACPDDWAKRSGDIEHWNCEVKFTDTGFLDYQIDGLQKLREEGVIAFWSVEVYFGDYQYSHKPKTIKRYLPAITVYVEIDRGYRL